MDLEKRNVTECTLRITTRDLIMLICTLEKQPFSEIYTIINQNVVILSNLSSYLANAELTELKELNKEGEQNEKGVGT